jgi:hypothetical protein
MPAMAGSPDRFETLGGHRIPVEIAQDPAFRFLEEAFEGRSRAAFEQGQEFSNWKPRQTFLNLVRKKVPKRDIASLVPTIAAAVFHYDHLADIKEEDFAHLGALLRFLRDYRLISEVSYQVISEEVKARVCAKARTFEKYLKEWQTRKREEYFEAEVVRHVEEAERISESKKRALERKAESEARKKRRSEEGPMHESGILGTELENREPLRTDLERLCPEERALVHAIKTRKEGEGPVN